MERNKRDNVNNITITIGQNYYPIKQAKPKHVVSTLHVARRFKVLNYTHNVNFSTILIVRWSIRYLSAVCFAKSGGENTTIYTIHVPWGSIFLRFIVAKNKGLKNNAACLLLCFRHLCNTDLNSNMKNSDEYMYV